MHVLCWSFAAFLAYACRALQRCFSCRLPSHTIRPWRSTFPSGMRGVSLKFRDPFSHARTTAKGSIVMEVARWSRDLLSTPRADFRDLAYWSSCLPLLRFDSTRERTEPLVALTCAVCHFAAGSTSRRWRCFTPSIAQIARARTKTLRPTVKRVIRQGTRLTIERFVCISHNVIVS
jgi:hypothetical protein